MIRRITSAAVAATALLAAFGCGGSGNEASVRSDTNGREHVVPADGTSTDVQTVTYRGVQFDVPADWPVHDLADAPKTCVRYDVHAVYLGHPSTEMDCPAGLIGRTEAVLVEPTSGAIDDGSTVTPVPTTTASGLELQVADDATASSQIDATIPSVGLSVTLSYRGSNAAAKQILQSFRVAS